MQRIRERIEFVHQRSRISPVLSEPIVEIFRVLWHELCRFDKLPITQHVYLQVVIDNWMRKWNLIGFGKLLAGIETVFVWAIIFA